MTAASLDAILTAFDRFGDRAYGEQVSQLEHALQAAQRAEEDGASEALILAALLHDYGHLADDLQDTGAPEADARHELSGAVRLKPLFGPEVVQPIALHVAAKRHLCAVDPTYLDALSDASRHSLELQGGPFSAAEAARFAQSPYAADAIRLRRYDDLAKVTGAPTRRLPAYLPLMSRLLQQRS